MNKDFPNISGKSILIVDDEEMIREFIAYELTEAGAQCLHADNGVAAFEIVNKDLVDFVISDVRMEGGSGLDLIKDLKNSKFADLPIVLISGHLDIDLKEAQQIGAVTFVAKPFAAKDLLPIISKHLKL